VAAAEDEPPDPDPAPDGLSITAVPPPPLEVLPEPGRIGPLRLLALGAAAPPRFTWPEAATLMAVLILAASVAE
jgi:hypothetical protein